MSRVDLAFPSMGGEAHVRLESVLHEPAELEALAARTGADELMITTIVHGADDRLPCRAEVTLLVELPIVRQV